MKFACLLHMFDQICLVSSSEGSPVTKAVTGSGLQCVASSHRTVVVFQAEWIGLVRTVL